MKEGEPKKSKDDRDKEELDKRAQNAIEEARKPFDLSKGPLWRFTLVALGENDHLLLITAHHIAIDGWSRGVFLRELGALYPALFRLVRQGLLKASWGKSDNNRRAKFYELTSKGRKRLREETDGWNRLVAAIASALAARPQEA